MGEGPVGERRAGAQARGARLPAALRAGFYRRLADDDSRAAYWVRHVRLGVALSEVDALAVVAYALVTPGAGERTAVLLLLACAAMLAAPLLLLLPLAEMTRDRRGPLLFYGWSVAVTVLVTAGTRVDGGAESPLFALLFLTLGFMAVAYPPFGVVVLGALMTASYLLLVAAPDVDASAAFIGVVMASFTVLCALASANQWGAYDRQVLLLRTTELQAATDPLTGCLNRRAFLQRLDRSIAAAAAGRRWVVCLVDLDGFKGVNDRAGHAAGDAVLCAVTAALAALVRETDTVARLGGDEFAVLAEVAPGAGGLLAARLREAVAAVGAGHGVTASVGTTTLVPGEEAQEVLLRADRAMYRAKAAGGDRVATPS